MSWKNYIRNFSEEYHFKDPATRAEVDQIKEELHVQLPNKLLEIFNETNGVFDEYGCPLIWSTAQIIEDNLFFRNFEEYKDIYMPFDHLLFFADAGNGDLFAYIILNGSVQTDDIYVWNHEDDSRTWISPSLEDFIKGWVTGKISV
ncbi:SMI1/KNR4 family protein [Bacillus gobiensis]|uniref:SMI1/KNR4 family protein n=1 Tax=Bacillus gobiensis TaxID=1441095 RepID=UPI003D1B7EA6